jgi:hypothetical protein
MYLSDLDIVAISIALVSLMALVVTSAVANSRMTAQRDSWRYEALRLQRVIDSLSPLQRTHDLVEAADFHEHITGRN